MENNKKEIMKKVLATLEAEEKAFEEAGLEVGSVEYTCPHCGGNAIANRYWFGGRIHGLGSGCKTCNSWHS